MTANHHYARIINHILKDGELIQTRNSTVKRLTNIHATFTDTPLVTIRKTAWKNALREMEWFLSGSQEIKDLDKRVHHWWKPWSEPLGYIWNNYGKQFRRFEGSGNNKVDQIQYMIDTLKSHPNSRRNVITTWNTADMVDDLTPITNCHGTVIQAFVRNGMYLDLTMYQRSADFMLGVQHNWIQYWALMHYLAYQAHLKVGEFHWHGGDVHIYESHFPVAQKVIDSEFTRSKAKMIYTPSGNDFKAIDFDIENIDEPIVTDKLEMIV
jgi:thymidylate synthase